jgi:hypothetical protein
VKAWYWQKKASVYMRRKPSLTVEQIKEMRKRVVAGEQKTGLAAEYGYLGQTWRSLGTPGARQALQTGTGGLLEAKAEQYAELLASEFTRH